MPNIPVSTALTEDSNIAEFKTKQNFQKKKEKRKKTQHKPNQNNQKLIKNCQRMEYTMDS